MSSGYIRRIVTRLWNAGKPLFLDERGSILSIIAVGWLLVLGTRLVVPVLLPQVKAEYAISNTSAGFAITLIWLTYAMRKFPAGILTDILGERRLLLISVFVATISLMVFIAAPVFSLFLAACVLFGLSTGLFAPPRVTILSRIYPKRDSTALGVTFAAGNVGGAALPFMTGRLSVQFGWRSGFGILVPLFLLVLVGLWRTIPRETTEKTNAVEESFQHATGRIAASLNDRSVLLITSAITLVVFTYQGFTTFFPIYLVDVKGMPQGTASGLFALFFVTGAVVQPIAGSAADQFGDRQLFLVLAALTTVTLASLPFIQGLVPLTILTILLGVRAGLGPINNAYLVAVLPADVQGASYGLLRTAYLGLGATGSIIVGMFADAALFDEAFLFLAALIAVVFGFYFFLPSRTKE